MRLLAFLVFTLVAARSSEAGTPETVTPAAETPATDFDHSRLDTLLRKRVSETGAVDYRGLRKDVAELDRYIADLGRASFAKLPTNARLAFWINAYNAFTLKLIVDHPGIKSIKDIPSNKRWKGRKWRLPTGNFTLDEIEHRLIRKNFREPRIHFALNCASISCPILRREAYTAAKLDRQLDDQTRRAHTDKRWFTFDAKNNRVRLSKLFDWFADDFEHAGGVVVFAARYSPELAKAVARRSNPRVSFIDWDWSLNGAN
ncbi:MAG: DUF547 domain-containing protein [Planctomycetota bacterium]